MRQAWLPIPTADRSVAHRITDVIHRFLIATLLSPYLFTGIIALLGHHHQFFFVLFLLACISFFELSPLLFGHFSINTGTLRAHRLLVGRANGVFLFLQQITNTRHGSAVVVLGLDAKSEGGHLVELHLGPLVEGMIVALGTLNAGAQENAGRVGHVVQRHSTIPHVVTDGSIFPGLALGRHHLADKLIVGLIGAETLLHKVSVGCSGNGSRLIAVGREAQHVCPIIEGVLHIGLGAQQLIDEFGSLVGFLRRHKGVRFPSRRDTTNDIEIDTADKSVVVRGWVSLETVFLPISCQDRVDLSRCVCNIRNRRSRRKWGSSGDS